MAKNGKKDKRAKRDKRHKRDKRSQRTPALAPARGLPGSTPALAVAAGALIVAGITSLWRTRR